MAEDSDVLTRIVDECDGDREFVQSLITLYRENPLLWDVSHEQYKNKYKRHVALTNICESLKNYKPSYTIEDLKRKLNILRTNFNKERNKVETRGGTSHLWYYNLMTFINKNVLAEARKYDVRRTLNSNPSSATKRKNISIVSDAATNDNEDDVSATYWAMKLRKLPPDQKLYAEKIINDTLFEGKLGTLTKQGVSFQQEPTWEENESPSKGLEVEIAKSRASRHIVL